MSRRSQNAQWELRVELRSWVASIPKCSAMLRMRRLSAVKVRKGAIQ